VLLVVDRSRAQADVPNKDLASPREFAGNLLSSSKELRLHHRTVPLSLRSAQYRSHRYGYVDEPGRWITGPSGFLLTQANDEEVDGTVVLMPGDIIAAFRRYVQSPDQASP